MIESMKGMRSLQLRFFEATAPAALKRLHGENALTHLHPRLL